ncbi:muramidase family protein [Flavobacterium agricola]|uniref:muramidase family protein n=1 Tax=Flavobacterium agricola TaxID=2870839 RepID=UPI002223CC29|nr:LysM peptidoglycan-binding domain-containing protein [Flavobacterium agricola]
MLDIPAEQIKYLNPIYKVEVIPYMTDKPHYLRLPKDKLAIYQANEEKIYAYVDYEESKIEKPFEGTRLADNGTYEIVTKTKLHKVKSGESLGVIASKNKVSIADLRRWNNIKGNMIRAGQNLKIQTTTRVAVAPKPEEVRPKTTPLIDKKAIQKKVRLAKIAPDDMYLKHVVDENETLDVIATNYNVSIADLMAWNEIEEDTDFTGQTLLISLPESVKQQPAKANPTKTAEKPAKKANNLVEKAQQAEIKKYVVRKGDTLYKISNQTGLSIAELKKVNNLKSEKLKPGQVLKI